MPRHQNHPITLSFSAATEQMAMMALAAKQPGFLGVESAREGLGITVSYWESPDATSAWKQKAEHQLAQSLGKS